MIAFAVGACAGLALAKYTIMSRAPTDLTSFVAQLPRGGANIPAQWFEMNSLVGWERMMLIIGYANNQMVCNNMLPIAKNDSPDREFRCSPAN
jgi:hypothetical protein